MRKGKVIAAPEGSLKGYNQDQTTNIEWYNLYQLSVYQGAWFQEHYLLESTPLCQIGWSNTQFAALIDVKINVAHPQA